MPTQISSAPNEAAQARKPGRRFMLRILGTAVVVGAIGFVAWFALESRWYEATDDAYVNGNIVQITPQITGTVVSIGADDGDFVKQGDVLVTLDKADADVALENAAANLANTVRKVRGLYSTVSGAQADVAVRQTAVQKAKDDYARRVSLANSGAISAEELSHAKDALTVAESSLTTAEQQLQTNKVLVDDTIVTSHPDVKAAVAQYRAAYLTEVRTTMVAPVTGYVAKRSVQVGQRVQPGAALMAVVPLHEVWIDANFKETQLTHMRIGQPVEVTSDIYGHAVKYDGKVLELGVGTGGAFSLLPAQNATGNWIKIVQRMPVRVVFTNPGQLDQHPLRVGMSLNTRVDLHDKSGPMLAQKAPTRPAFSTDIYEQQLAHADEQVAQLIHRNMASDAKLVRE
ncbi:efflux RND transporter periplasmic adaptor subunit [Dyella halodurans]|uniref:Efflux RND transporter periplasmic adaptor subunit n=1 Tax=Dyella halodurans TaxID=1920171 RepID=A0ABV9C8R9_9GAMM|nr:efflux RND transporter periplasmic adaptor subunit [Dyella halodurans]